MSLKCKAKLLASPDTEIEFAFHQIEWPSIDCEPKGIMVSHYYSPAHNRPYCGSAIVLYDSLSLIDVTELSKKENGSEHVMCYGPTRSGMSARKNR
ncbi:hypothetical protein ACOW85_003871 [Vibrio parahaemolyticus]